MKRCALGTRFRRDERAGRVKAGRDGNARRSGAANTIRAGCLTAREVTAAALDRAAAMSHLGAIGFIEADCAVLQADWCDQLLRTDPDPTRRMPLFGVPFLMNDLGSASAGFPVICGSQLLGGFHKQAAPIAKKTVNGVCLFDNATLRCTHSNRLLAGVGAF